LVTSSTFAMKGKLDGSDVIMTSSVKEFRWSNYFAQNRIEPTSLISKTSTTKTKWTLSLVRTFAQQNNKTVSSNKTCNLFSFCKNIWDENCVRAARTWYCDSKVTKPAPDFFAVLCALVCVWIEIINLSPHKTFKGWSPIYLYYFISIFHYSYYFCFYLLYLSSLISTCALLRFFCAWAPQIESSFPPQSSFWVEGKSRLCVWKITSLRAPAHAQCTFPHTSLSFFSRILISFFFLA